MVQVGRKKCRNGGHHPIKLVQLVEGNFLRDFVDYIFDKLNKQTGFNAGVAVVQPIPSGLIDVLNEQDGLYCLYQAHLKSSDKPHYL